MVPWAPARGRGRAWPKRRTFTAAYKARILRETTRRRARASGVPCCAAKGCTPRISRSGGTRATRARRMAWRKGQPDGRRQRGISRDREAEDGEREAHSGAGSYQSRAGGRGESTRALGTALRERGLRYEAAVDRGLRVVAEHVLAGHRARRVAAATDLDEAAADRVVVQHHAQGLIRDQVAPDCVVAGQRGRLGVRVVEARERRDRLRRPVGHQDGDVYRVAARQHAGVLAHQQVPEDRPGHGIDGPSQERIKRSPVLAA